MTDRRILLLFLAFLTLAAGLQAQEPGPVTEEAESPEALFDQKIGDVGVVLQAEGTWNTRLAAGTGAGFPDGGSLLAGLGYPGFERGLVFTQVPDFSLTLRLLDRWYLGADFRSTLVDRAFVVGYDGRPGEAVQWVKLGNTSFSVPPRAGDSLSEGRRGAPAAGAALTFGPVDLELLGRYEDGSRETRVFRGYQEETSVQTGIDAWIRNRFFRLPGAGPFSGVRILAADSGGPYLGTRGRYREALPEEAAVDPATGEVRLAAPAARTYLVTWNGAPGSYGPTPLLGLSSRSETLSGGDPWLVLVQPGFPSPFELRNRYPVAKGTTGAIFLTDRATLKPLDGHPVSQSPVQDWFEAGGPGEAPFFDDAGGAWRGIYPGQGQGTPPPVPSVLPWVFQLPRAAASTQGYSLGSDVDPSSLAVVRNGLATGAFRFDAATGILNLDGPVFDTDTVKISYQRRAAGAKAADLVLWQGGRWDAAGAGTLEWNLQGRWNLEQSRYTTEDLQSPGRFSASAAWKAGAGEWSWSLEATGGALLADSTGRRRLYGQTTAGTQAVLDSDALRPSAPPGTLGALTMTAANRAPVYFRDHWTSDPLTGVPQAGVWGSPGVGREPWTAEGWTGPYLVRGDGVRTDRLAVVETDLGAGQWAGAQVFLDRGRPVDLRSATAVTLVLRVPEGLGGPGGAKVHFQAGTLSEDFDATGAVRTVTYRSRPALAFSDQGTRRYFPLPENSSWGNDGAKDGAADPDGDLVYLGSAALPLSQTETGWQTLRIVLTDQDRQRLSRTTGWRLVLEGGASALGTRTLLAGPVVFEGAGWSVTADPGASGTVSPAEADDPERAEGRMLLVGWAGRPDWTVEGRHSPLRPAAYRTLSFRYKVADLSSGTTVPLTLRLTDAGGRGLKASWTASSGTGWVEARIGLRDRTFTVGGASAGTVALDSGTGSWDRMVLGAAGAPASGTLYVAEIEAVDPEWEPVATSRAAASWRQAAPWPSAEVPLVTGGSLTLESRQSGLTAADASWSGQTALSGSLGPLRASGEASFQLAAGLGEAHGAYETTLPLAFGGGPALEWTDRFSDRGLRSERFSLSVPWAGRLSGLARADGPPATLNQEYRLSWDSPQEWFSGLRAKASAEWLQTRPGGPALEGFGRQWVDSWGWLVPLDTAVPYHLVGAAAGLTLPWALEAQARAQASQTSGATVKWSPSGSWELKWPLRSGEETGWTLTPVVSKKVEAVFQGSTFLVPRESAAQVTEWLISQTGGLADLPFAEQGSADPWQRTGLQTGAVESVLGLDWTRSPGSDWSELVLPLSGGSKFRALRGREASADYRTRVLSAYLQARAVNLFGTLGSVPVLTWYRTDVWTWSASGAWSDGTRDADRNAEVALAARNDLVLTSEESLGVPLTYGGRWGTAPSQTLGLKPGWTLSRPADLPFELPRWLSPKAFRRLWVQDLTASLAFGWDSAAPPLRDLLVSWKGRLLLSEKSELGLTARWGQQWQNGLTVASLEASLDFLLSF